MKQYWDSIDNDYFQQIERKDVQNFIDSLQTSHQIHQSEVLEEKINQNTHRE